MKLNQQVLVNYAKRNKQSHLIVFSVTVLVSLEVYIKHLQKHHKIDPMHSLETLTKYLPTIK